MRARHASIDLRERGTPRAEREGVCAIKKISASAARPACRAADIPFETTAEVRGSEGAVVGQERAAQALRFGVGIRRHGYNLFAAGPAGVGKQTFLREYIARQTAGEKTAPSDWCYVHDFANPERPRALELPSGMGVRLQRDMTSAITELRVAMRSAFESDGYRTRRQQLVDAFSARQERALADVQERATPRDVIVLHTDTGFALAPLRNGTPLNPEGFRSLPKTEQERLQAAMEQVGTELQELLQKFHEWGREHLEALKALDRETSAGTARRVLERVRERYAELPAVLDHLGQIELDVIESAQDLLEGSAEGFEAAFRRAMRREHADGPVLRYQINLLADHTGQQGPPIVYEDNPTYTNLIGRIEHESQFGALLTNFTLIKAGAFHRAQGGYLLLDALKVLQEPFAWDAVKRTLRSGEIRVEALGQALGLVPTVSLQPAPVPLGATKVILTGERALYYLLAAVDLEFLELFKVLVDFEDSMERRPETQVQYANLVASLVAKQGLRPFNREAVAAVIDHAVRAAGDAEKLSVHMRRTLDLVQEADFWAGERKRATVAADDIQTATEAQLQRASRLPTQLQEATRRGDILIATSGESVGQVNGLSVLQLGEFAFGHPTRITARVRLGKGELVDIEREVALGGPIHSKGVLILGGFLGARYATSSPLSLSATLVFEQSYGGVEGDSASLAELCALLSAIADVPLKQSLAITGSVNQHGEAQAIGAVNEKIEGFFDVCRTRGLTGEQGVLIPSSNAKNLMLRRDVADALDAGQFHLYAIESVDDALSLLAGLPPGERDGEGRFPECSMNARVEARLVAFAEQARMFLAKAAKAG